jgi:thioredoxin-related protein
MKPTVIVILCFLVSCKEQTDKIQESVLYDFNGRVTTFERIADKEYVAFVFFSPDCPLCVNYTKTLRELAVRFHDKPVKFIPVYLKENFSNEELGRFHTQYQLDLTGYTDSNNRFAKLLNARVTPQAILVSRKGDILYSGAIDNYAYDTGKKRQVITQHYLEKAITSVLHNATPEPSVTEPVGCLLE